jgi:hypothetical protein
MERLRWGNQSSAISCEALREPLPLMLIPGSTSRASVGLLHPSADRGGMTSRRCCRRCELICHRWWPVPKRQGIPG